MLQLPLRILDARKPNTVFAQIALKEKYKYRIIMEESFSFGVLGKRGAGIADHYNLPVSFGGSPPVPTKETKQSRRRTRLTFWWEV